MSPNNIVLGKGGTKDELNDILCERKYAIWHSKGPSGRQPNGPGRQLRYIVYKHFFYLVQFHSRSNRNSSFFSELFHKHSNTSVEIPNKLINYIGKHLHVYTKQFSIFQFPME